MFLSMPITFVKEHVLVILFTLIYTLLGTSKKKTIIVYRLSENNND
jgi:hypothetical protein